jgi:hypothetical protein
MLTKNNIKTTKSKRSAKGRKPSAAPAAPKPSAGSWKEVRPEKVARAKRLLQDPNYPSGKVMGAVARLMARHLSG